MERDEQAEGGDHVRQADKQEEAEDRTENKNPIMQEIFNTQETCCTAEGPKEYQVLGLLFRLVAQSQVRGCVFAESMAGPPCP